MCCLESGRLWSWWGRVGASRISRIVMSSLTAVLSGRLWIPHLINSSQIFPLATCVPDKLLDSILPHLGITLAKHFLPRLCLIHSDLSPSVVAIIFEDFLMYAFYSYNNPDGKKKWVFWPSRIAVFSNDQWKLTNNEWKASSAGGRIGILQFRVLQKHHLKMKSE